MSRKLGLLLLVGLVAAVVPAAGLAGSGPSIAFTPTTSPGVFGYGFVSSGSAVSQTFVLANSGDSSSAALKVGLSGSGSFTKTADGCTANHDVHGRDHVRSRERWSERRRDLDRETCTVTVTYTPASAGANDSATLTAIGKKASTAITLTGFSGCIANRTSGLSYTTLQAADTAASPGDTLAVYGTCQGGATLDKNLTIVGNNGYGTPTLQGGGAANPVSVVLVRNDSAAPTVSISGVSITGGQAGYGGGIVNYKSILTLTNVTVTGNATTAGGEGGGILNSFGATLTLTNSTVGNNTAAVGGGIENYGALTLNSSTVSNNSAVGNFPYVMGGGIYSANGTLTITNSTVSNNTAANHVGGGIDTSFVTATITGSTISNNTAATGGGLDGYGGASTITNSTISGNIGTSGGGGIYSGNQTLTLTNSTVSGNTTPNGGGGIFLDGGAVTLTNPTVTGNTASLGGGIYNFDTDGGTVNGSNPPPPIPGVTLNSNFNYADTNGGRW